MVKYLRTASDYAQLISRYDHFLFDLDGVVWLGDQLTPGVVTTLNNLRESKKRVAFVTNNSTLSRVSYLSKMERLGIKRVSLDMMFSCGSASASYLKSLLPTLPAEKRGIYVVGQVGLEEELREAGLVWKGGSSKEDDMLMPYQDFSSIVPDPSIGVVLFGFNMHLNYKQLCKAFTYLATNNAKLVLTNDDSTVIVSGGVCPGEGAMASILMGARKDLQRQHVIVGKPHKTMYDEVRAALSFDPKRTLFIGDRLETDIMFGINGGIDTMLVLTGASKARDLVGLPTEREPTYVGESVGAMAQGFE